MDTGSTFFDHAVNFIRKQLVEATFGRRSVRLTLAEQEMLRSWLAAVRPDGVVFGGEVKRQFGKWFEGAVANRVVDLLLNRPELAVPVVGVWCNVEIAIPESPEVVDSEFDIAILLCNATLLHIECKTRTPGREATYSQLARMRQVGGEAARMIFLRARAFRSLPGRR